MPSLSALVPRTTLSLFCLLSLAATADPLQVYRWADKTGRVTFTDSPLPPSPDHHLVETQSYTPPSPQSLEQGQLRLEELRAYNREHPLPVAPTVSSTSTSAFSKMECEAAMRHYEIESGSLKNTRVSVAAAEAEMRTKCNRPERESAAKTVINRSRNSR
ncbi:exported hypothetical protein [Gammaproteobacteria bacterium]